MSKLLAIAITIFLSGCAVQSTVDELSTKGNAKLNFNQNSVKGLVNTYAFILGQEHSLEKISKEYPDLSYSVMLAEAKFNSSFPKIKLKLKRQLILALGESVFKKTETELSEQLITNLGSLVMTRDIAQSFLQQIKERAEGKIDSPFIEYMLTVEYLQFPEREYIDGYRQEFNSDGNRKSLGINLVLQVPKSWKAKEGERPHIVQKWVSQNGTGLDVLILDIRDTEAYTLTDTEVESFISTGEVKESLPSGAIYEGSGLFSLENNKGYWVEMSSIQERAGIKVYQHSSIHQLFYRGKAISLTCYTASPLEDQAGAADESYKRIKPLCQQVLNSMVLLQKY